MPDSPAALALTVTNGRWQLYAHVAFLSQALVYLSQRAAPAGFLRRMGEQCNGYADDDLVPFTRLIIEEPPRHGKSELTSRFFTAWYLGMFPWHRVILTSYEANYARSWGRKARDVLERFGKELFGIGIRRDTKAANEWEIDGTDGGMITAGVGGPITGRGANLLVVDDPVKNAEEAASETIQERNDDWWKSTAYTRLEPDADGLEPIVVIIQTRWNEKDLAGKLIAHDEEDAEEDEHFVVLKLPAIAEENDPLGRQPGEALWPERYGLDRLARILRRIGAYFFGALYQQRPAPVEGSLFKRSWWQRFSVVPRGAKRKIIYLDPAQSDNPKADYSVFGVWVTDEVDFYLINLIRVQVQFPELVTMAVDLVREEDCPIVVEETSISLPLIQTLKGKIPGVIGDKPGGKSKVTRAMGCTPYCEAGNVFLPERARWVGPFIEELAAFPNGSNDDQVDITSGGVNYLAHQHGFDGRADPPPQALGYEGGRDVAARREGRFDAPPRSRQPVAAAYEGGF